MTSYRLRTGVRLPGFTAGQVYLFLQKNGVEGYFFLDVNGRPTCIHQRFFEAAVTPIPGPNA